MSAYLVLKYLHVIGAAVLLGTGAGIAFFMLLAHRTGDAGLIAGVARIVVAAAAAREGQPLPEAYHRLFRTWFAFGFPAFAAVLAIFWLMLARPQFG
jgi:uncharacterized membrane protein